MNRDELYNTLMDLLEFTTPSKQEHNMYKFLPKGGRFDKIGNYILEIGDSKTIFACHLDTVGDYIARTNAIYSEKEDAIILLNKNAKCLGGDDRCGMLCLLALIDAKVPGTYIFHVQEESGALGAEHFALNEDLSKYERAIEFDRKGTNSIITHMCWDKVCSDEFADQLAKELNLNFEKDDGGMFTDVFEYRHFVPEVTNISVGYSKQHSSEEKIDVLWLIDELIPSIIKVNWESLVSVRDHTDVTSNVANLYQNFFNHYDEKITEGQLLDEDDIDIDNLFSLDDEEELNLFGWQKRHDLNWCHFCWFDAEIVSKSDSECETFFCKNCESTVVVPYGTFDPEAPNNYESYSRVEHP